MLQIIETGHEQYLSSNRIINHENYDDWTVDNDISLIEVFGTIQFNDFVKPICLDQDQNRFVDDLGWFNNEGQANLLVSGWGSLNPAGSRYPDVMNWAAVKPIFWDLCNEAFGMTQNMICAGYINGGIDACSGDSGGPMAYLTEEGVWVLNGIVSWGIGCAEANHPGVYTKVANYGDWIAEKTGIQFGSSPVGGDENEEASEVETTTESTDNENGGDDNSDQTCGAAPMNDGNYIYDSTRIVGGSPAKQGWFPWQVALMDFGHFTEPFCSGSVIHKNWVLTAAHCVSNDPGLSTSILDRPGRSIYMSVGLTNWIHRQDHVQFLRSQMMVIHPNYEVIGATNDVAMIMTDRDIQFNDYVQPVCLNYNEAIFEDELSWANIEARKNLYVSGWGNTQGIDRNDTLIPGINLDASMFEDAQAIIDALDNNNSTLIGSLEELFGTRMHMKMELLSAKSHSYQSSRFVIPQEMQYVTVKALFKDYCSEVLHGQQIENNQLCAGTTQGGRDICAGDGGAGLVQRWREQWTLVGVASYGYGCKHEIKPGIYSKVSSFVSWIDFTLGKGRDFRSPYIFVFCIVIMIKITQ